MYLQQLFLLFINVFLFGVLVRFEIEKFKCQRLCLLQKYMQLYFACSVSVNIYEIPLDL